MPKQEVPIDHLANYLPAGTSNAVTSYLHTYKVHLTIAKERSSILGDYRHRTSGHNHRISVNGNLNTYSFLVTLLHELAHLLTFEKFGNRIQPHGREWKMVFGELLQQFLKEHTFPPDIEKELMQSLHNPAASSCAEEGLLRVLRKYDSPIKKGLLIEELQQGNSFRTKDGRIFLKGEKLRKRFKCREVSTGRDYLFSPVYEVELV